MPQSTRVSVSTLPTGSVSLDSVAEANLHPAIWVVLTYFFLHLLLRSLLQFPLSLDESQQISLTESLAWGYGPHPPLYTWLQYGLFRILGHSWLALALLKNGLLALTYLSTYATIRLCGGRPTTAAIGMLGLLTLPQICWESQRALTHSVLAVTMTSLTVWQLLRTYRLPSWGNFAGVGICMGLGMMTKYNYAIPIVALLIAACMQSSVRRFLRAYAMRLVSTVVAMLAVGGGHLIWVVTNFTETTAKVRKFNVQTGDPFWQTRAEGAIAVSQAIGVFFITSLVVLLILYWSRRVSISSSEEPMSESILTSSVDPTLRSILTCGMAIALVSIVAAVLVSGTTTVKDRWLQPIGFLGPTVAVLWLEPFLDRHTARRFFRLALVIMCGIIVTLVLRNSERFGPHPRHLYQPDFEQLLQINPGLLAASSTVLMQRNYAYESLRWHHPEIRSTAIDDALPVTTQRLFLMWQSAEGKVQADLAKAAEAVGRGKAGRPIQVPVLAEVPRRNKPSAATPTAKGKPERRQPWWLAEYLPESHSSAE